MLQHFQATDDIEMLRLIRGKILGGALQVLHVHPGFQLVQPGHRQRGFPHVDAGDPGPALGHGLGQDAAAAAHVDQSLARHR